MGIYFSINRKIWIGISLTCSFAAIQLTRGL